MSADQFPEADVIVEAPEGSPELKPLLSLPRRRKGPAIAAFMRLIDAQKALGVDSGDDDIKVDLATMTADQAEQVFGLMADIEDALKGVAVDPDAFETWALEATDGELANLATSYMRTFQVGEASASSES